MPQLVIEVPDELPYILLCVSILSIECILVQYFALLPLRASIFNGNYMYQFSKDHEKMNDEDAVLRPGGFPDSGNGFYSDKLEYKQWYELNNGIRVQANFIESMPQAICFLIVGAFAFPKIALGVGALNCLTRPLYVKNYLSGGPNKRLLGAVGGSLPLYLLGWASFAKIAY